MRAAAVPAAAHKLLDHAQRGLMSSKRRRRLRRRGGVSGGGLWR